MKLKLCFRFLSLFCCCFYLYGFLSVPVSADTTEVAIEDATEFWNKWENDGHSYTKNGVEYVYFCTKGLTASGGTKWKTIGYTITCFINGGTLDDCQVDWDFASVVDSEVVTIGGESYTFGLKRISVSKLYERFQKANEANDSGAGALNILFTQSQTFYFNSIMTVTVDGVPKGSITEKEDGKVSDDKSSGGEVYYELGDIWNARAWKDPSSLVNYFDKDCTIDPSLPISVNNISVSGSGNVYPYNGSYYVRTSTNGNLSFTSTTDFYSSKFKPNANQFLVTGYGANEIIDIRVRMTSNDSAGKATTGALGYNDSSCARTNDKNLTSTIATTFNIPDANSIYVYPVGKVFLGGSFTSTSTYNYKSDDYIVCETKKYDETKRVQLIGDALAPSASTSGGEITLMVSDSGSGIRNVRISSSSANVVRNYSEYTTYATITMPTNDGAYTITATDNVGNVTSFVVQKSRPSPAVTMNFNSVWNPTAGNITATNVNSVFLNWKQATTVAEQANLISWSSLKSSGESMVNIDLAYWSTVWRLDNGGFGAKRFKTIVANYAGVIATCEGRYFYDTLAPTLRFSAEVSKGMDGTWSNKNINGTIKAVDAIAGYSESNQSGVKFFQILENGQSIAVSASETYTNIGSQYDNWMSRSETQGINITTEGRHDLYVEAKDVAENSYGGDYSIRIDKTAPKINVQNEMFGQNGWNPQEVTVTANDNKDGVNEVSGIAKMEYYYRCGDFLDSSKGDYNGRSILYEANIYSWGDFPEMLDSSQLGTFFDTSLGSYYKQSGRHFFKVRVYDKAGNSNDYDYTINLDLEKPTVSANTFGGIDSRTGTWNPTIANFDMYDALSGLKYAVFKDGGGRVIKSVGTMNGTQVIPSNNGHGYLVSFSPNMGTIYYTVYDLAGNKTEGVLSVRYDSVAPTVNVEYIDTYRGWNPKQIKVTYLDNLSGLNYWETKESWGTQKKLAGAYVTSSTPLLSKVMYYNTTGYTDAMSNLSWNATDNAYKYGSGFIPTRIDKIAPTGDVAFSAVDAPLDIKVSNIIEVKSGVDNIWGEIYDPDNPTTKVDTIPFSKVEDSTYLYIDPQSKSMIHRYPNLKTIRIIIYAIDKAGNAGEIGRATFELLSVNASIKRIQEPYEPLFKGGEKGVLTIELEGFLDRVKITFPYALTAEDDFAEKLVGTDQVTGEEFIFHNGKITAITTPKALRVIEIPFFQPIEGKAGSYFVDVVGYRNTKNKEAHPAFSLTGSILDEIRTRIRK